MKKYFKYTQEQLDKLGNTLIYLSNFIADLSKTKALKLIYILDETSIKKSGIPFLNLNYHLWKYGPVDIELFAELSNENLVLLKDYIRKEDGYIKALKPFNNDEFSDNDIDLMNDIIKQFGDKKAKELSVYTHKEHSLWRDTAEANEVLYDLLEERMSTTDIVLDMSKIVSNDTWKAERYKRFIELN